VCPLPIVRRQHVVGFEMSLQRKSFDLRRGTYGSRATTAKLALQ
jgi:hypothetical protein